MVHGHGGALLRREKRCGQGHVLDISPRQFVLVRKKVEIDVISERGFFGPDLLPYAKPLYLVREREAHDKVESAKEGVVQISPQVARQDCNSLVFLHLL